MGNEDQINILEMEALVLYLKKRCCRAGRMSQRLFHVFVSKVCIAIVAKGRSSSKRLNRKSRQLLSLELAADVHPIALDGFSF